MNKRDILQLQLCEDLKQYKYLIAAWATGVGKGTGAIKCIEDIGGNWYIILYEKLHKKNWIEDFKKHDKEYLLKKIKFLCYASIHKIKEQNINIILDEGHHLMTDLKLNILKNLNANMILILSGSFNSWMQRDLENKLNTRFKYCKYKISEAIEDNILKEPKIYCIGYELSENNIVNEHKLMKKTYKGFSEVKILDIIDKSIKYWNERPGGTFMYLRWCGERKKFLSYRKNLLAKQTIDKLKELNLRFTSYFIDRIQAYEIVGPELVMDYKKKTKDNALLLDRFNSGDINQLYMINMGQEGLNLVNIHAGLIVQLDNKDRKGIQCTGRTFRADNPIQVILYVKNTMDEKYLNNYLENVDKKYVYYILNPNEISL